MALDCSRLADSVLSDDLAWGAELRSAVEKVRVSTAIVDGFDEFEIVWNGGRRVVAAGENVYFSVFRGSVLFGVERAFAVGCVTSCREGWAMSNLTAATTLVVENIEDTAELVKVAPRRAGVILPFEISRVLFPIGRTMVEFKVFGPSPKFVQGDLGVSADLARLELDEQSKYFTILVALCEPRLRGSSMAAIPSVQDVVNRLKVAPNFTGVNRSAVNYHIDYLRSCKLPIAEQSMSQSGGRMHSKREALVAFALRYDLVREEHLALLPPKMSSRTRECG